MRYKRPDRKSALSILEAAERDMKFTLKMKVVEEAGPTIARNVYECFRMLGDALLAAKGLESIDHVEPIKELIKIEIKTTRPIYLIDNLRRLRININYYGYRPNLIEVKDVLSIAESIFEPLLKAVLKIMKIR